MTPVPPPWTPPPLDEGARLTLTQILYRLPTESEITKEAVPAGCQQCIIAAASALHLLHDAETRACLAERAMIDALKEGQPWALAAKYRTALGAISRVIVRSWPVGLLVVRSGGRDDAHRDREILRIIEEALKEEA